ncbi:MAG: hypothetical protein EAZ99_13220 [Alphaproteobacteria bacterium]|nr:protein phosphatase CheZ [Alphaproteobacteria bacterium]TAD88548.1 MAG: hypothetical protein EAZ99_13220 [Alphaproteobacteria bacterium]
MADTNMSDVARELTELRDLIRALQGEVAMVRHPFSTEDRLSAASQELDAIVRATEGATNSILATAEEIGAVAEALQGIDAAAAQAETLDRLVADLFTQCSFQDITGQRVQKVVTTLTFVEQRIEAMIAQIGEDTFAEVPVPESRGGEAALLNGPQLENKGVNQSDIDALFG